MAHTARAAKGPLTLDSRLRGKRLIWRAIALFPYPDRVLLAPNFQPQVLEANVHGVALMQLEGQNALG